MPDIFAEKPRSGSRGTPFCLLAPNGQPRDVDAVSYGPLRRLWELFVYSNEEYRTLYVLRDHSDEPVADAGTPQRSRVVFLASYAYGGIELSPEGESTDATGNTLWGPQALSLDLLAFRFSARPEGWHLQMPRTSLALLSTRPTPGKSPSLSGISPLGTNIRSGSVDVVGNRGITAKPGKMTSEHRIRRDLSHSGNLRGAWSEDEGLVLE
ncbi:hypothetical protein BOTBODRAFT_48472 [Botryobasidium botryosum FD-172 SS1]|uniref:Uncharacterized protein n=1 Tax=Botryobasidium botryosum (strain FD-172 SS1) TaxID=930990 RepID=A0A067M807_BOTB1|nr:hypothetical protein BOTBODRAFT_48472 [Botryobasidium botryosum FD-172 SS1]